MTTTTPHRTNGVDDEASRKPKAGRDPHFARWAPHAWSHLGDAPTRRQQVRTRCSVYRAIDTTTAKHSLVRRIDDDVNGLQADITHNDLQARCHGLSSHARLTLAVSRGGAGLRQPPTAATACWAAYAFSGWNSFWSNSASEWRHTFHS